MQNDYCNISSYLSSFIYINDSVDSLLGFFLDNFTDQYFFPYLFSLPPHERGLTCWKGLFFVFFQKPFACFTICHCAKALAPSARLVNGFVCLPQLKQSFKMSVIIMIYSQFHCSKWYSYQMCNEILVTLFVEDQRKKNLHFL